MRLVNPLARHDGWRRYQEPLWAALDQVVAEEEETPLVRWAAALDEAGVARTGRPDALALAPDPRAAARLARYLTERLRLQNLAEDLFRLDRVRARREAGTPPRGSVEDVAAKLVERSPDPAAWPPLAGRIVLTSHPTESTRRTVLQHVRRIAEQVRHSPTGPVERARFEQAVRESVRVLWRTPNLRPRRPAVGDEIELGLVYVRDTLFDALADVLGALEAVLAPRGLRAPAWGLDSWIGGDRDGHPGVDAAVTLHALLRHHQVARELWLAVLDRLEAVVSAEAGRLGDAGAVERWVALMAARFPEQAALLAHRYPLEPLRQAVGLIRARLSATEIAAAPTGVWAGPGSGYAQAEEFVADLEQLARHWDPDPARRPPELVRALRQARIFGFHLVSLDVRQHARVHREALAELAGSDPGADPESLLAQATDWLGAPPPWRPATPVTRDLKATLEVLARYQARWGPAGAHRYLVSMAHHPVDLLAPLVLARTVDPALAFDVVPVFETLADLDGAVEVLERAWDLAAWRAHVEARGRYQEVMLGFSDSTKDAGPFAAMWGIYRAQRAIARWARTRGVTVGFFHGRGGALGRGGGPTSYAVRAQPPECRTLMLRITQQGEVLSQKFLLPEVGWRSLELMITAQVEAVLDPPGPPDAEAEAVMDGLARRAWRAWRDLVEDPGFWEYFLAVTPIREMTALNWGSRPSWRESFRWEDLRAIPWVFAWTQNRLLLPAWYGAGTALSAALEDPALLARLRHYLRTWPYWTTLAHNLQLALARVDLRVAAWYQDLAQPALRDRFWPRLLEEHRALATALAALTGQEGPLAHQPSLSATIAWRHPRVAPLHALQVAWLERYRRRPDPDALTVLAGTMEGIAVGVRNTG